MKRRRERLELGAWPLQLQQAWSAASTASDLFADSGAGQHWASATRCAVQRGLGLYLGFLESCGELHLDHGPADILTTCRLKAYAQFCFDRSLRPTSIATRFNMLNEALRVMAPQADRSLLIKVLRRLQKTQRAQPKKACPKISASELYEAGLARMDRVSVAQYEKRDVQAVQYGDGLMMAMLAAKPLRIGTLGRTDVGVHLVRSKDRYVWSFGAHETKNAERSRIELPARLTPYIDRWLQEFRPVLLKTARSPAMWISCYRNRMSTGVIYYRFCSATQQELGVRVNPHQVRAIVATSVAVAMPNEVRMVPALLDLRNDAVAKIHYILADRLSASDRYLARLETRREEAKHRGGKQSKGREA